MIAVTGGAGFIGSRLVERLVIDEKVTVIDNLSSGKRENVPIEAELKEIDLKEDEIEPLLSEVDTVFHFAANPKVNTFPDDRDKDFEENLEATKRLLDACINAEVEEIVFASSSVVYGEDVEIPTPEDANFEPISMYAATKAGGEHMMQVYASIFDLELTVLRYANIIGPRNTKGVIWDFIHKLKQDPEELEILGNGLQKKSYLYIEDAVDATLKAWRSQGTVYNIGSEDSASVNQIADIVSEEMKLDPDYSYTGGEKGWEGDVPEMRLSIDKLKQEGWKPERNSEESIRKTVQELLEKLD